MKLSTTYRLTLSDGKKINVESCDSAASAISETLWKYRGRRVVGCYSGLKQPDIDILQAIDITKRYALLFSEGEMTVPARLSS